MVILDRAISRVDLIKLLLQLAWDIKAIDTHKYITLGDMLSETGKMLGGWKKQISNKTPEYRSREK